MPQLEPFFWLGQLLYAIGALTVLVYMFGTYVLPLMTSLQAVRNYITKL